MSEIILEPLKYPFMQNALLVGIIISITCAFLSCFIVWKDWALLGDGVSHAVLPGVVLAYVLGMPIAIGATFSGLLCAILVSFLEKNTKLKSDSALGVVFISLFALGILLFFSIKTDQHLMHILLGNILGITKIDRWQVYIISSLVIITLILKERDLKLFIFDKNQAKLAGISLNFAHYLLLILLTITSVVAIQAVGAVLVVAMLIAPALIAQILTKNFELMILVAIIASVFSALTGVLLGYHYDCSTSAAIVLMQGVLFIIALILKKLLSHKF